MPYFIAGVTETSLFLYIFRPSLMDFGAADVRQKFIICEFLENRRSVNIALLWGLNEFLSDLDEIWYEHFRENLR
jgi:hypothetical protein